MLLRPAYHIAVSGLALATLVASPLAAQPADQTAAAPTTSPAPADAQQPPLLKQEELEQLLAPIALYPDSLLTQMLMASTYPLEIVQADRWVKANKDLKGDALATELEKQDWDPSVKSMVNFPDQLAMMSEKLDLTMKLGDAFMSQQSDVMNTVQVLRSRAQASGNLKSSDQQTVAVEAAPTNSTVVNVNTGGSANGGGTGSAPVAAQQPVIVQAPPQVITIQSPSPQVVYVPTYSPTVVYGAWPYLAYPPAPYHPPGYVASSMISFGAGVAMGAAWGYAWGHSNWGHGDVDINVNQNVNYNRNIDRSKYQTNINNVQGRSANAAAGSWQHDPTHRRGAAYPNQATAQRYGGASSAQASQARDQYRGRSNTAGAQDLNRTGAGGTGAGRANSSNFGGNAGTARPNQNDFGNRGGAGGANVQDRQSNPAAGQSNRGGAGAGNSGGAFGGTDRGASDAAASQRGNASRSASPSRQAAPARSGGGGGGAGRAGGGGRR
jgi:hypothetical protein